MATAILIVVAAFVGAILVAAVVSASKRAPWVRLVHRRVVVVSGDRSIEGVLWERRGPLLVLRDATIQVRPGSSVPADGELVIERDRIDWIQVLPA